MRYSGIFATMALGACCSCTPNTADLVGHWSGTYACDFPPASSVRIQQKPFPVEFTFTAEGLGIREEPMGDGRMRRDTTPYEVKDGRLIWDHGDEASDELERAWNGDLLLIYEVGGGRCVTRLEKVEE